jgi:hypothetical protein
MARQSSVSYLGQGRPKDPKLPEDPYPGEDKGGESCSVRA